MGTATRGRKIQWRIWLPEEIAVAVEVSLFNPGTGKPDYGARSHLVAELLQRHLAATQLKDSSND